MKDSKHDESQSKGNWSDDFLGREEDARLLQAFVQGQLDLRESAGKPRTYVLNLDSGWGSGKTFFLDRFAKDLADQHHVVVRINAWDDDQSKDSFLSVVSAVQRGLREALEADGRQGEVLERTKPLLRTAGRIAGTAAVGAATHWAKKAVGNEAVSALSDLFGQSEDEPVEDIQLKSDSDLEAAISKGIGDAIDITGKAMLDSFESNKAARANFRDQLAALARSVLDCPKRPTPIYILIDELDRCRPAYAVDLLENVKHLFSVENFVFVLGTDTDQLSHAIKGLYGGGFDGKRYLRRFIDRTYKFQKSARTPFIEQKYHSLGLTEHLFTVPETSPPNDSPVLVFLDSVFSAQGIELRDIEQMMDMIATFASVWEWSPLPIDLVTLLPLIVDRHLNVAASDITNPTAEAVAETRFRFQKFNANKRGGFETLEIELSGMADKIQYASSRKNSGASAQDEFEDWLHDKVFRERTHFPIESKMRDTVVNFGLPSLYPILLDKVARLQN